MFYSRSIRYSGMANRRGLGRKMLLESLGGMMPLFANGLGRHLAGMA